MKYGVYAMRDRIAENFQSLNLDINDAVARRNFSFAVNNSENMMFSASDLEFFRIGEFDSYTGVVEPCNPIQLICRADEVIKND